MNHLAVIQNEFVKEARKWDDLSYDEQKGYLKRHPKSKRKLTAKPEGSSKKEDTSKKKEDGRKKPIRKRKDTTVDTSKIREKIESKKKEQLNVKSDTPVLDKKIGKLYDAFSSIKNFDYDENSSDFKKINKIWEKEFPDENHKRNKAADIIYGVLTENGLVGGVGRKPTRKKPLTKEEFVNGVKDIFSHYEGRLPKVEGEEDPTKTFKKKYKVKAPFTSKQMSELQKIESELSEDEKQYAKYLVKDSRPDLNEKRSLADVSGDRPIIKSEYNHPNFGKTTKYEVPTSNRYSGPEISHVSRGAGEQDFITFSSIEDAKDYIKKAPKLEEKADLRDEIKKVSDDTDKSYLKVFDNFGDWTSPLNSARVAEKFQKYPREDQMGVSIDTNGKRTEYVAQKGRKFNLSPEEHKNIAKAIGNPTSLSSDELENAVKNYDSFVKDVKSNKDIFQSYDQKYVDSFLKHADHIKEAIKKTIPKVKLFNKLMDQHGYEKSKEDIKLPEGFKFKDKPQLGKQWGDSIIVGDDNDTMEMIFDLGKPGQNVRITGEVYYKVPEQKGVYSLGRRGIDIGMMNDWNDDRSTADIIKDYADKVKAKQDKIGRSVDVKIGGGTWKVTPENVEKIKKDLQQGKSQTFAPHGMGTGYILSMKPSQYSKRDTVAEKTFGVSPLYIQSYDHD